jgi:hypothetical protein
MSDTFQTQATEPTAKHAIAIRYGLMVGFVTMFLTTVNFLYILKWNYIGFLVTVFLMFAITIILYGVAATRQRKALGGYISMKDAFQVVFIVILISLTISTIYGLIYNKYIDPEFLNRMKESMINFFEKIKAPQDKIDEAMKKLDESTAGSTKFSKILYSFAQSIIIQSIFGFIVALIVKKDRPATQ